MNTKAYQKIAEVLVSCLGDMPAITMYKLVSRLSVVFKEDNPDFDRIAFDEVVFKTPLHFPYRRKTT